MTDKNKDSYQTFSELLDSGEIFTGKLVLILQGNAFHGALPIDGSNRLRYRGQKVTPIVPLKSLILRHLEPREIAEAVSFEQIGTEIRVYFNPPPSIMDDKEQAGDMKSYDYKKGDMIVHMAVPLLEIWPDFVSPDWEIYFSYFSNIDKGKTFYVLPFTKNSGELVKTEFKNGLGKIEREIVQLDHFPEAYECKTYWTNSSKQLVSGDAGILLLKKPGKRKRLRKKFNIGVNFGVTCTNIYIREERNLPEPMVFNDHLFKITDPPPGKNESKSEKEKIHYFFPSFKVDFPILNIFNDFHLKETGLRPFLDGHIYFPQAPGEPCTADNLVRVGPKSETACEWGRVKAYLEQLCLMCTAEVACKGAEKIKWCFSYPNSLSSAVRETFKNISKGVIRGNSSTTGIESFKKEPLYKNEIISTSGYFSNHSDIRATIPEGVVFMTIGTRASNISIWQGMKDQLLVQTSIPFAGWGIFSYPLWKRTDFFEYFCNPKDMQILTSEELKKNKDAFYNQLEALVNVHCELMLQKLPSLGGDRIARGFRQLVALAISGLFYYIGLMLSSLSGSDIYEACTPEIYIGGSGSRLLHWLADGNYSPYSAINRVFRAVFFQAYDTSRQNSFRIVLSLHPGAEAAYDLAADNPPLPYNKEKMREFFFLAGETFENLNGEQFQWDTRLSVAQIKGGIKISSGLEHLETFLNAFDQEAASAGIPLVGDISHWLDQTLKRVNQTLSNLAAADENKIRVEPLFIIALKELLELKVDEWAGEY
ncbi:MAG: hypothetical protein PVH61_13375 [Candidatus Aminicenantes bacterium]|jgi:hypothetical protein